MTAPSRRPRAPLAALLLPALLLAAPSLPAPAATHAGADPAAEARVQARLLEGIEANFSGDYDRARGLFESVAAIDPTHPARELYLATVLFWRINPDPSDPQHDAAIFALLEQAIAKASARLARDPDDLVALHYLGLGYSYRGRLEAQRGRLYRGGTDGEKGRDFLERALALCERLPAGAPERAGVCEDLRFPLGAYSYYAGRLPGALRLLSFLWFVPRGSCAEGLAALDRARQHSALHGLGAQSLLTSIFALFEEGGGPRAAELSRSLVARFPDNPYLDADLANHLNLIAEHGAAAAQAERVLKKVNDGMRNYGPPVELMAELALAESQLGRGQLDEAASRLKRLRAEPRFRGNSQTPRISLVAGMLADLRGERAIARHQYRACKDAEGRTWNRQAARVAEKWLETPYRR